MPLYKQGISQNHLGTFTVATLPTPTTLTTLAVGDTAYATDALKASETTGNGTGNMVFRDAGGWKRVDTGAAVGA